MPEYHFTETKKVVYELSVLADSEEEARKIYEEIDDLDKDVNDSDTISLKVSKPKD